MENVSLQKKSKPKPNLSTPCIFFYFLQVLEYVKETIKGERTVLLSTVVHTNLNSDTYVDVSIYPTYL